MKVIALGLWVLLLIAMSQRPLPIAMPAIAPQAWEAAQSCSQLKPKPGFDLARVHWYVDDLRVKDRFHAMIGLWIAPDTIILDPLTLNDSVTVVHELLHYLLQPAPNEEKHPVLYFVYRCHLLQLPVGG